MATNATENNITLTTEKELSLFYRILRTVVKPLRPRLTKPGKPLPAGSPRLSDHPETKKGCSILERKDDNTGLWLYRFVPKTVKRTENTSDLSAKHKVLYFAGGGFQSLPAGEHWSFVSTLAAHSELCNVYEFTIVSYPLAPNSPAADSLPVLRKFLRQTIEEAAATNTKVSLMGDSSGGNIALSLGFWWVDQLQHLPPTISVSSPSDDEGDTVVGVDDSTVNGAHSDMVKTSAIPAHHVPHSSLLSTSPNLANVLVNLIPICPTVDLTSSNPAMQEVDKHDPVLGYALARQCGEAWTSSSPTSAKAKIASTDPTVSPVLFDHTAFSDMSAADVKIHGIIGSHDVLAPDTEIFRKKCVDAGVRGEWLVWQGQMHCFALAGMYGMREGQRGTQWLVGVLGRNA